MTGLPAPPDGVLIDPTQSPAGGVVWWSLVAPGGSKTRQRLSPNPPKEGVGSVS